MPGLINKSKRSGLPLSVSDITSCVRGYTLAMTASLTYENIEDHPIEGIFIYPLEECSVVVGLEAMIGSQIISVQVKDKTKIDDCYFDCCHVEEVPQSGGGHVVLDEDQERTVLVVNLGVIPPLETINILVSTSSELCTLPNGGILVTSPPVCSPRVQRSVKEEQAFSPSTARRRDKHHCSPGTHEQTTLGVLLSSLLEEETINSIDYAFNFQLEIRGPYLLAGVESPSHAIRADADPLARSASSIVVTLADKYTYDCPVEILIYPSEPHLPHILIEDGDMTPEEYDEHLKGRSDYIKATKKDCSNEKIVDIIRKRLHKDILHNPVVMLNFCPYLCPTTSDLRSIQGEFIFLIDRSGSMSGVNISRVKDAMVVILKSLFPACLFNIVGFGSKFKTLFATSQSYDEETLALACEHVKKIRADMGGTNLLAPLNWILRQPMQKGHPRLLFLLTDGAIGNTGKVIELLRSHARFTRCYTFGIGQGACRRLVLGLSTVSRGTAEFLAEGERLQPKMIKSLKKTMTSVLTDISIEWLYPETKEILLSPVGATCLFPGDRLIGYSVICDTSKYHSNPKSDKRRRYSMMRSNESTSSVFYHSQEEDAGKVSSDSQGSHRENQVASVFDSCQDTMSESSSVATEQDAMGCDMATSPRRRAYSTNQIVDYNPAKKVYTPSDPSSAVGKNPLRRAKVQELIGQTDQWKIDYQPQLASLCATSSRARPVPCHKPPQQEGLPGESKTDQAPSGPSAQGITPRTAVEDGSRSSTDSPSLGSTGDADGYTHQLCEVETPQDPQAPEFKAARWKGDCKAVVSGLLCGKPVKWEVTFDIQPYLKGREREEKVHEDLWNETFHHLAGRSIIQDFEHMADKECEIENGSGRRYQLYAIHTSKACNILSKYTAFVPIDLDSNEYLPTGVEYSHPGEDHKRSSHCSSRCGSRKNRGYSVGLARSQSGGLPEQDDVALPCSLEDGAHSPCKTSSSSSGDRCSVTEASQRTPSVTSDTSQRSTESLFSASKLSLTRTRLLTKAARGFMSRSQIKTMGESENDNRDYIPLVTLQMSCGAFRLDDALCEAINVPMDKLKWTSPFASHRISLTHPSHSSSRRSESLEVHRGSSPPPKDSDFNSECEEPLSRTSSSSFQSRSHRTESCGSPLLGGFSSTKASMSPINSFYDSGRGSESEIAELPLSGSPGGLQRSMHDPEGMVWATAVALAWLEHSSASYFIEWELIAAKASMWLDEQIVPEGRDLASVKAGANQLFIILRHWDENLQLNMLCYNPSSM
ncbi:von Willebrand factor A domain-containing protein 5B1 isoform X2 [Triplophysa rosa]|uniref:von Willebrand factor A domain-containing protein 5B1 n=1 Tax=Triplophysa rosa TaxID=992332 RepID=A0A9W7WE36_TRIRA|nr:von Willebrand factor A domain-containing protein 5B1 isoform X2 [Triplophysa rosa]KAI7794448.1 putative von Willebrand factor A domain-containing protein 5B1 [Triplophysa rosa]